MIAFAKAHACGNDFLIVTEEAAGNRNFAQLARILCERNIPFVFASGYGADGMAGRFEKVPVLTKPFHRDELGRALGRAMVDAGKCTDGAA